MLQTIQNIEGQTICTCLIQRQFLPGSERIKLYTSLTFHLVGSLGLEFWLGVCASLLGLFSCSVFLLGCRADSLPCSGAADAAEWALVCSTVLGGCDGNAVGAVFCCWTCGVEGGHVSLTTSEVGLSLQS
uniref:Uncharacterized protein n=1 Tax=Periophthalmus magnuspinnatus TaxID=409849 RepID=A0A3B3ZX48_9GOBI